MKEKKLKLKNILIRFFSIFCICFMLANVYAASSDDWWGKATEWYKNGETNVTVSKSMVSGIADFVEVVGTAVIAIATVVIGMKFMFGTVQGKSEAKENLINLLVACIFFFGWSNIRGLLITGNATGAGGLKGDTALVFFQKGNYKEAFAQLFTLVVTVAQMVAVASIVVLGVKYVFAGADAKAQLKQKSPGMIVGIILIFCTVTVLKVIAKIISGSF